MFVLQSLLWKWWKGWRKLELNIDAKHNLGNTRRLKHEHLHVVGLEGIWSHPLRRWSSEKLFDWDLEPLLTVSATSVPLRSPWT